MLTPKSAEFESVVTSGMVLICFSVPWCAPCRVQETIMDTLDRKLSDRMTVALMNVEQDPQMALRMEISSVPTLVLFANGQEISRFVGLQSEVTLADALEKEFEARKHMVSTLEKRPDL